MVDWDDVKQSILGWLGAKICPGTSIFLMIFGLALTSSFNVEAHRSVRSSDQTSGISIPNLTHGQLHIMIRYRSAILDLANRQIQPGVEARSLQNFINLQFAYCLWGLIPGSLSDEANPFNECSHAYLAASKALLDRLRKTEETRSRADALTDEINLAMLQDAIALEICSNSFEPFNTAQVIMPEWASVAFNPLGVLLGFVIFGASAGAFAASRNRGLG